MLITFQQITSESGAGWAHPRKMVLATSGAVHTMSHCVKTARIIHCDLVPFLSPQIMLHGEWSWTWNTSGNWFVYDRRHKFPENRGFMPIFGLLDALCPDFLDPFCCVIIIILLRTGFDPGLSVLMYPDSTLIPVFPFYFWLRGGRWSIPGLTRQKRGLTSDRQMFWAHFLRSPPSPIVVFDAFTCWMSVCFHGLFDICFCHYCPVKI